MSPTKSATMPVIDPAEGHPIDPDVIVPDGDASLREDAEGNAVDDSEAGAKPDSDEDGIVPLEHRE